MLPFQPNPFASATFGSPWSEVDADVPSINGGAFRTILAALRQMRAGARGTSIVITGEPGTGKTHLLGRFRKHLEQEAHENTSQTVYVYVRANASGGTLWRHLQYSLASDLLKPDSAGVARLAGLVRRDPARLDKTGILAVRRAVECIAEGRHPHIAAAWLRGEPLADSDLAALAIAVEKDDEDRSREMEARRVVDSLLGLLAPTPVVLCFDQVEALAAYKGDESGFHVMGQVIAALSDNHEHLLLISCMVSAFEDVFDRLPNGADRDRWLQTKLTLRPIEWQPACDLVKARLDAAPALAATRRAHAEQPLWPFDPQALRPLFEATGVSNPRLLIRTCKGLFDQLMGNEEPGPARDPNEFLHEQYTRNLAEARRTVHRLGGDKTLADCLPWLLQTSKLIPLGPDAESARYAPLGYRGPGGDTAVVLLYQPGVAFTNRLKKVRSHWTPPTRLHILRDPAIRPGPVGARLLAELERKGARQIHPLPEALAALQAIRDLTATALSGELTLDGTPLGEQEVTDWALRNLPPQLEKLREDLAGAAPVDPAFPRLSALVRERKVIEGDAAARELSVAPEEVSACAHRHPMQFGILEGPPLVLFEAVEGYALESADA